MFKKNKKFDFKFFMIFIIVLLILSVSGCSLVNSRLSLNLHSTQPSANQVKPATNEPSNLQQRKYSDSEILSAFDEAISLVAEKVKPSIINLKVKFIQQDFFGNQREAEGVGSGIIYISDGYIITSNHVVDGSNEIIVTLINGKEYPAKIVGADENTDVAVIKIEPDKNDNLSPAEFTSIEDTKVGELAIAIGSPFGLQETVTTGVVSALGRNIPVSYDSLPLVDLIQTDAAINPGNSGGALVNSAGQVIGVNTMIYSTSGANAGIGFAIPSDTALNIANQLIKYGKARIPFLGIEMDINKTDIEGVLVKTVTPSGPADKSGIKVGDIIISFDGEKVETPYKLFAQILRHNVGDTVKIELSRNGKIIEVEVTLTGQRQ
jgi:S1-C subfamily serine protease